MDGQMDDRQDDGFRDEDFVTAPEADGQQAGEPSGKPADAYGSGAQDRENELWSMDLDDTDEDEQSSDTPADRMFEGSSSRKGERQPVFIEEERIEIVGVEPEEEEEPLPARGRVVSEKRPARKASRQARPTGALRKGTAKKAVKKAAKKKAPKTGRKTAKQAAKAAPGNKSKKAAKKAPVKKRAAKKARKKVAKSTARAAASRKTAGKKKTRTAAKSSRAKAGRAAPSAAARKAGRRKTAKKK